MFGTSLKVDFRLVPLLKGLRMGLVSTQIVETQEFMLDPDGAQQYGNMYKDTRPIGMDEYHIDPDADSQILDEAAEGYNFSRYIELPKSLNKCLQDTETRGIKIRHKLKFNIQLHNPDGHTSELRATLPVSLYISPSLPLDENNDLVDQTPFAARQALASDLANQVPPLYGEHLLDQLYSGVDPSGYRTPGGLSMPGTPFGSYSRNISSENLASLDATTISAGDHVSPAALQSRLQNLGVSGPDGRPVLVPDETLHEPMHDESLSRRGSAYNGPSDSFVPPGSSSTPQSHRQSHDRSPNGQYPSSNNHDRNSQGSTSTILSRRASGEEQTTSRARTPVAYFHEVEDLSRVPSYHTAVTTPAPTAYSGPDLPSYGAAMVGSGSSTSATPAEPPAAHVRVAQSRGPSTWRHAYMSGMHRRGSDPTQDEESRLRLMQARGRG